MAVGNGISQLQVQEQELEEQEDSRALVLVLYVNPSSSESGARWICSVWKVFSMVRLTLPTWEYPNKSI